MLYAKPPADASCMHITYVHSTHNTGATILAGVGETVVDVGLAGVPCEAHDTRTGEVVHQILQEGGSQGQHLSLRLFARW